jgi:hypothetical protein
MTLLLFSDNRALVTPDSYQAPSSDVPDLMVVGVGVGG